MITEISSLLVSPWYIVGAFVSFYVLYGFEMWLNDGHVGRPRFVWPFMCFWEEFLENIPGGMTRKERHIQEMVSACEDGYIASWSHEHIRRFNAYRECAKDAFKSPAWFWIGNVLFMFVLWPLSWALFILGIVLNRLEVVDDVYIWVVRNKRRIFG